jgi:hypothetical protein
MIIALVVAGCGTSVAVDTTITIEQAEQCVEDYFHKALAVLPAEAQPPHPV